MTYVYLDSWWAGEGGEANDVQLGGAEKGSVPGLGDNPGRAVGL